jgi:CRISPR type I-E-associated protein CasB/Cse2
MTTALSTKQERLERANKFFKALAKRIEKDSGSAADLRRALSGEERHLRNTYPIVLSYLGEIKEWQQDTWILVAALFAYYPQEIRSQQKDFGSSCRGLAAGNDSGGVERRFRSLLDTSLIDMRSPLTNLVRQMKSKGVRVDYPQLLVDLLQWEHSNQYIQDRWARTFWGAVSLDPEPTPSPSQEGSKSEI